MRRLSAGVARTIRDHHLAGPGDRVAIAVSGGADSVALTHLLRDVASHFGFHVAGLIHVNHQLRATESDNDEGFCRELAATLDLPIDVSRVDVAAMADAERVSREAAARDARYSSFHAAAGRLGATLVATGHTMDDQAETVLMRLMRGAGTRGLSGIRVKRGHVIRPLLGCRRDALREYLTAIGQHWREDSSNTDISIPRNRVRRDLMPVVADLAPSAVEALARLATFAADDEAWLMAEAIKTRPALVLKGVSTEVAEVAEVTERRTERSVDAVALGALPPALGRRAIRMLAAEIAPESTLSADHLEAVWRLARTDKPVGHLDLPGLTVERSGSTLWLGPGHLASHAAEANTEWLPRRLDVPGSLTLPEAGVVIDARFARDVSLDWQKAVTSRAALQARLVQSPLFVRNRRPGDRFRPLGAPGSRKLQDLFVDRKIPRTERDRVPVVLDAADRIVWVVGVAVAHDCRVTTPEDGVLILEKRTAQ